MNSDGSAQSDGLIGQFFSLCIFRHDLSSQLRQFVFPILQSLLVTLSLQF